MLAFKTSLLLASIFLSAAAKVHHLSRQPQANSQALPKCAVTCLVTANFGNCSTTDNACLCKSSAFVNGLDSCIQTSCNGTDATNALADVTSICQSVNVPPPPPPSNNGTLSACAAKCLATANFGNCSASDDVCLCNNSVFVDGFGACILNSCSSTDYNTAESDFKSLCQAVGITTPSAGSLPSCAATCLANANLGGCAATDNQCLCENSAFISSTQTCFKQSCTGPDLTAAQADVGAICKAVGVNITATS